MLHSTTQTEPLLEDEIIIQYVVNIKTGIEGSNIFSKYGQSDLVNMYIKSKWCDEVKM